MKTFGTMDGIYNNNGVSEKLLRVYYMIGFGRIAAGWQNIYMSSRGLILIIGFHF